MYNHYYELSVLVTVCELPKFIIIQSLTVLYIETGIILANDLRTTKLLQPYHQARENASWYDV
jgi:hypothetical protein